MVRQHDDALLLFKLFLNHLTEHALAEFIVMAQSFVHPLANLVGDHGAGDELRMRMLEAGAGVGAVVLKKRDVSDTVVETEIVVSRFVTTQDIGHLGVGH